MGCRGTIEIWNNAAAPKSEERPVVLYTHWGAKRMLNDLITTLKKKERWNDPPYLSRMIFIFTRISSESNSSSYTE